MWKMQLAYASLALGTALGLAPMAPAQGTDVIVNGAPLSPAQAVAYGIDLPPGRYWYDPVSGFWGIEGQGYTDQASPLMQLGGPLRPDASNGGTGVFVNGREIVARELAELQAVCGPVPHGRYWLNHELLAGPEGAPAACDASGRSKRGGNRPSDPNDPCHNPQFSEDKIECMMMGYSYTD